MYKQPEDVSDSTESGIPSDHEFDDISPSKLLGSYTYLIADSSNTKLRSSNSPDSLSRSRSYTTVPQTLTSTRQRPRTTKYTGTKSKETKKLTTKSKDTKKPATQSRATQEPAINATPVRNTNKPASEAKAVLVNQDSKQMPFSELLTRKGFRFLGTLGSGGYGEVSLVLKVDTGEKLALKVAQFDNGTRHEVNDEINIWKSLQHKNVVKLLDTFEHDDKIYFVQNWATGGDIAHYVRRLGAPPIITCKNWLNQIFNGLLFMHQSLIAHLDLKLRNLLLTDQNSVVQIADFGVSKRMNDVNEKCTSRQGTPGHVPPEILKGEEYDPFSADVWGLGVVSYHLLSGEMPFNREVPLPQLLSDQKALKLPFIRLNRKDPNSEDFIRKAFTYIPSQRPSVKSLLLHPFLQEG